MSTAKFGITELFHETVFDAGFGRTAAWKKAMVTLDKGQTIDVFEGA